MDMAMLFGLGGQERTLAEYDELFAQAGIAMTRWRLSRTSAESTSPCAAEGPGRSARRVTPSSCQVMSPMNS